MWYNIFLGAVTLICLVVYLVQERYRYFEKKGIPSPKPQFLVGNSLDVFLLREPLGDLINRVYSWSSDQKSSVVGFYQGVRPVYVIRDPALVTRVLVKDFSHFHDHGFVVDEEVNPLDGNLFASSGTKWRTLRKKLTPTFTSGKLKWMFKVMETSVDYFLDYLDDHLDEEIEIKDAFCRLTTDVIGSCAFGIDSEAIKDPNCQFRKMGKKIFNPGGLTLFKGFLRFLMPSLFIKLKLETVDKEVRDFMFSLTKQTFEYRLKSGVQRNDFIQLLLQLREKGEVKIDPSDLEDDEIVDSNLDSHQLDDNGKLVINDNILAAQLFVFFVGGFETAATGLSFMAYLLSKHQEIQEKARREVKEAVQRHGCYSYDSLKEMPYLDACIKEAMRLYPPFSIIIRKCTKTYTLENGSEIQKGEPVFIPIHGLQKDPKYFPEPEKFKPERFLNWSPVQGTYLPFGDGPRICIAQRFAQIEMKLTLAKMLSKYRIHTCPKMTENEPIKFSPRSFVSQPVNGIWCTIKKL